MIQILLAQKEYPLGDQLRGIGPIGDFIADKDVAGAAGIFNKVLSVIIGVMTVAAGLWFLFQFFIGAFTWLTSGGDKVALENARKKITNAIIGLVIVVAAIFLIDLIGNIIGLDILSPSKFLIDIWKK
jgi:hypothetical protein